MLTRKPLGVSLFITTCFLTVLFCSQACADYAPGQIAVKFKPGVISMPAGMRVAGVKAAAVKAASVSALNSKYGVFRLEKLYQKVLELRPDWTELDNQYVLVFPEDRNVQQVAAEYGQDANVAEASPISIVHAFDITPDDPRFGQQYGLTNMQAPQAWERTTGESSVLIAVLDTGVNYDHEDLAGRIDLADGYDFVNEDPDPWDDHTSAHGTTVTGVIGAATNNSIGVAGVDWSARILPVKVLNWQGDGLMTDIKEGIAWARAKGADVINMSFGQYNSGVNKYLEENPGDIKTSCQNAYDDGIVLVAAAGNGNVDWNTYPAYYSTVLAVAAVDADDKRAIWSNIDPATLKVQASNYGTWVDVAAPGDDIMTTQKNNDYVYTNGTSMACPFVVGLAGLIKSVNPGATNQEIMDKITSEVDNIDGLNPGYEGLLGSGRINAYLAVAGVVASITEPASNSYVKGVVPVHGSAAGWDFASYTLEAWQAGTRVATITAGSATPVEAALLGTWPTAGLDGEHTIKLTVYTNGSGTESAQVVVYVDNTTPEAAITSPTAGADISGDVTILGSAKDEYFERSVLEYGAGASPASFEVITENWVPVDAGSLGTWETAGLDGLYTIRLTAYDKVGSSATTSLAVNVLAGAPVTKEVNPQPPPLPVTYALPNPFDRTTLSEISFIYSLETNFEARIYLFDLSGKLVWQNSYAAGENGGKSGENSPSWDGKDQLGGNVPNGVYFYKIVADGRIIAQGKVVVLN
ncbi:S8 family serine peptidase [Candidatus Margulisiibacteriota bacterium]